VTTVNNSCMNHFVDDLESATSRTSKTISLSLQTSTL
jgi:hypothetical protein